MRETPFDLLFNGDRDDGHRSTDRRDHGDGKTTIARVCVVVMIYVKWIVCVVKRNRVSKKRSGRITTPGNPARQTRLTGCRSRGGAAG